MTTFSIRKGKIITDNTGAITSMRVLTWSGGTSRSLINYCLARRLSQSWQKKLLRAIKIFLEYLEANPNQNQKEVELFCNFRNAIFRGTINADNQQDPSGLYWRPIGTVQANYIICQLSDFFEWLTSNENRDLQESNRGAVEFNPRYSLNQHEKRIELHAFLYRKNKAFLGHTWSWNPKAEGRRIRGERVPKILAGRPPMFPDDRFEDLLFAGFKAAGKYDYRGMLITLLLFGGGLRSCEPFHLFAADVQPNWDDPDSAFVAIHHPNLGLAPNYWRNSSGCRGSRREYLYSQFGLEPRHESAKNHAGWKHSALDAKWYMQVHWFPEFYGHWFMQIWKKYMEQIVMIPRDHPYAWINMERDSAGEIYQLSKYRAAFAAAVERIGLKVGKAYGTTPHGLRHAYGQRARKAGIDPIIIQRMLHHSSIESQQVYTQPEISEATLAIRQATDRLRAGKSITPTHLIFPESTTGR